MLGLFAASQELNMQYLPVCSGQLALNDIQDQAGRGVAMTKMYCLHLQHK